MNILDIVLLLLFAFFLLSGWYSGFINTIFSLSAYALSCLLAFLCCPLLSGWAKGNAELYTAALYYTEGAEYIKDVELARSSVSSLGAEQLSGIMEAVTLPIPMEARISENIATEAFQKDGIATLGEYFNQTIVNVFINIACILVLFCIIRLLFAFAIHLIDYARMGYPVLQSADGLLGASFGLIRGFLAMYILFLVTPVVLVVLPSLQSFLEESFFGNFFYNSNFLLRMVPGT